MVNILLSHPPSHYRTAVCDTSLDNGFILSVSQTIDSLLINTTMGYLQSNGYQTHNTSFMVWLLFAGQSPPPSPLPTDCVTNEGLSGVRSGVTCQTLFCQTIISTMITNINGHQMVAIDNIKYLISNVLIFSSEIIAPI